MSATGPATAEDFSRWRELARGMSDDTLRNACKDCRAAATAVGTHDKVREGYYMDQLWTFDSERARRFRLRRKAAK